MLCSKLSTSNDLSVVVFKDLQRVRVSLCQVGDVHPHTESRESKRPRRKGPRLITMGLPCDTTQAGSKQMWAARPHDDPMAVKLKTLYPRSLRMLRAH